MTLEVLKITWKIIRKAGHRTPDTYCSYIAENENHKHKLKTVEDTKLFELLKNTTISANNEYEKTVVIDGMYYKNKLIYITNPRIL
jgi:hypothetical protein